MKLAGQNSPRIVAPIEEEEEYMKLLNQINCNAD
jgi:hypothetical protein